MSLWQRFMKRSFDLLFSIAGLVLLGWLIVICWFLASIDTRKNGIFTQERIGQYGRPFKIMKIRTMRPKAGITTVVTRLDDPRITRLGAVFRRFKLDELPQLLNVLFGQMSIVGPRPDVASFADCLQGDDRKILSIRPGITGPATLTFRNEEALLSASDDPELFNKTVIFPEKIKLNRQYVEEYRFANDLLYIIATLFPGRFYWAAPPFGSKHGSKKD